MKNVQPKIWPSYSLQYISIKIKNLKTTFFFFFYYFYLSMIGIKISGSTPE